MPIGVGAAQPSSIARYSGRRLAYAAMNGRFAIRRRLWRGGLQTRPARAASRCLPGELRGHFGVKKHHAIALHTVVRDGDCLAAKRQFKAVHRGVVLRFAVHAPPPSAFFPRLTDNLVARRPREVFAVVPWQGIWRAFGRAATAYGLVAPSADLRSPARRPRPAAFSIAATKGSAPDARCLSNPLAEGQRLSR